MENDNGIQVWTVPKTGSYRIRAAGARGGGGVPTSTFYDKPGKGMTVEITTTLTMGEKIKILVGQSGESGGTGDYFGGGGGGSFVVQSDNTAILVAGGGGGLDFFTANSNQLDGLVGSNGGNGGQAGTNYYDESPGTAGSGGTNGNGGSAMVLPFSHSNGGGGGFETDGSERLRSGQGVYKGASFKNGGRGGINRGGFGGGGGGLNDGGGPGGGGYSGGGVGSRRAAGGGGGSFSITGSFTASGSLNYGDGYVTITQIQT